MSVKSNHHVPSFNIVLAVADPHQTQSVCSDIDALLGFCANDFLSNTISLTERIHSKDSDVVDRIFTSPSAHDTFSVNFRIRHQDGRICCVKCDVTQVSPHHVSLTLYNAKALAQPQLALSHNPYFIAMMENTDDFIYFKDRNHVFTGASQTLVSITQPTEHWTDLLGKTDYDVFPESYADIYYELEKQVFSGVFVAQDVQEMSDNDGNIGWVDNRKYPIYDAQKQITGLFGIARNITESLQLSRYESFRTHILEEMAHNQPIKLLIDHIATNLESLFPNMRCAIIQKNNTTQKLSVMAAPRISADIVNVIESLRIEDATRVCSTAIFTGKSETFEQISTRDFKEEHVTLAQQAGFTSCWSHPIFSADENLLGILTIYFLTQYEHNAFHVAVIEQTARLIGMAMDHDAARAEIQQLAFYDTLTKLANRRLLFDRLAHAMINSMRHGHYGCVMFVDLDNFKRVNDTLGHDYGDLLLQQVVQRLLACVRAQDTVARLGGDEFIVMIESLTDNHTESIEITTQIAEKILMQLGKPYQLGEYEYLVTPSIGATLFGKTPCTPEALIKEADTAMYQAKTTGKNKLCFFEQQG